VVTRPKILCGHCNTEIRWGDKFCGSCGVAVEWPGGAAASERPCPRCGSATQPEDATCPTCGAALRGQRGQKQNQVKHAKPADAPRVKTAYAVAGLAAAALVVFVIAITTDRRPLSAPVTPAAAPPVQQQPVGPNMLAIPQIQALESQVAANPGDMVSTLQLANLLHDNRFFDRAIQYYRSYLKKDPKNADARVDLGICLHELGSDEEAKKEMKQALADNPKHLNATFNLGIITLTQGNLSESKEWFEKTVTLSPNSELGKRAQQLLTQHSPQLLQKPQ